jgi:hypothetical protein
MFAIYWYISRNPPISIHFLVPKTQNMFNYPLKRCTLPVLLSRLSCNGLRIKPRDVEVSTIYLSQDAKDAKDAKARG